MVKAAGGAPIAGATVAIAGTNNHTTTDAWGYFMLPQKAGSYTLKVSALGFVEAVTPPLTLTQHGAVSAGNIPLAEPALSTR